jgi:hypothetical protein
LYAKGTKIAKGEFTYIPETVAEYPSKISWIEPELIEEFKRTPGK